MKNRSFSEKIHAKIEGLSATRRTIGVTGFSGAGKTVFIGALAQALLTAENWISRPGNGPLAQFSPIERATFVSARIRDDLNIDLPQFPFQKVRSSLLGKNPEWPEATDRVAHLCIEIITESKGGGVLSAIGGRKVRNQLILDIVDFPGEWLADFPMLNLSYADWCEQMLKLASHDARKNFSADYFEELKGSQFISSSDGDLAGRLAESWTEYLQRSHEAGFTLNQPGRHLRPDALLNSPILRFSPLSAEMSSSALYKDMEKRYEEYKRKVVQPFLRDHFSKVDSQIVLVDVLRTLEKGEYCFDEMTSALRQVLACFRYGSGAWTSRLPGGAKTSRVLFAATKADHVIRCDRSNLREMLKRMLDLVDDHKSVRASVGKYEVMDLASFRTTSDKITSSPPIREVLFGKPADEAEEGMWDPGGIPLDMPPEWSKVHFRFYRFSPICVGNALHEGLPSINLGKALNFLLEDVYS